MVVGVFGGFNVQQAELRILGAPPLAASRGSELCAHWRKESSHVLGLRSKAHSKAPILYLWKKLVTVYIISHV